MEKIMKITTAILSLLALTLISTNASADKYVGGYTKKDGSYVQGHYKSDSDSYRYNNKDSQSNGGSQRDEYSSGTGATNKGNSSWGYRDNDNDGYSNPYDRRPDSKKKY
jgi:hypothetical protein